MILAAIAREFILQTEAFNRRVRELVLDVLVHNLLKALAALAPLCRGSLTKLRFPHVEKGWHSCGHPFNRAMQPTHV